MSRFDRRDDALVALGLALLALVLALTETLWRADRLIYDAALLLWRQPPPEEVLVVAIDDASIAAIGRWPWKRSVHATLLHTLAAARPKAIVLDLVLSEPDPDPRQDELLAAALRAARPVVMPVSWQSLPGEPWRPLEPVARLRDAVRLGAVEAAVDLDGVLRHAFVEAGPAAQPFPHLAVAALAAAGEAPHPALALQRTEADAGAVPGRRQGRFLIRYSGPPGHVQQVSYVDVLRGAVPARALQGRYLLVGMTAQGLGDTLATPVNAGSSAMPGIEVLAHTLATLRRGDAPHELGPVEVGVGSALAVAALVAGFGLAGTRFALVLALAALPLALVLSVLALAGGVAFSPAAFMLAAAPAYPLWSWRRLERAVSVLDGEIAQLAAEPGLLPAGPAGAVASGRDRLAGRLNSLHTAADTLRSARRFLADAVNGLPTAMLVDDGQGRVALANPPAAHLFDVADAAELHGLDLARLLAEFRPEPALDWSAALDGVRASGEGLAVQAPLAEKGHHLIHAQAARLHGETRLIVAITDIAPIKRAERARDELLAFVSHDLRSPATSIVLLAGQYRAGHAPLPPEQGWCEVERLAQRTLELADDFVRIVQAAQRPLQLQAVTAGELLAEALADFRMQAEAAGVTLVMVDHGSGQPPPGPQLLDRALVQRAIGNLISNAIRHSPCGATVSVSAAPDADGSLLLTVQDSGSGLAPADMQRLMQAHDGLTPADRRGVGFGLLFVQQVARRHRGALLVAAVEPGPGARFQLRIGRPA